MTHRALIVAAVSTPNQAATDKASIPEQLAACRSACDAHGWPVVAEITIPGHSRNYDVLAELIADCPEYGQIIRTISSGNVSLFVAYVYDRLWRTDALRAQVTAICRKYGVQVYTVKQPMEPLSQEDFKRQGNQAARWVETVGGLISEGENASRIERMKMGKQAHVRAGYTVYSGYPPYGYIKGIVDRIIVVDPLKAQWGRWIFERRALDRWGYQRIAHELERLGVPSPHGGKLGWTAKTISNILKCAVYYGAVTWGKAYCETGKHEPIITRELWQLAQQIAPLADNAHSVKALTGLCICGYCDHHMIYGGSKNSLPYFRCSYYLNSRGHLCQCHYIQAAPVEFYVYQAVLRILSDPEYYIALREQQFAESSNTSELDSVDRQLADLSTRLSRWSEAFEMGRIGLDELIGHRQRLGSSIDDLQHRRSSMLAGSMATTNAISTINDLSSIAQELPTYSPGDLRAVYARLIHHITLLRGKQPEIVLL